MAIEGRTVPGAILPDPDVPRGYVTVAVSVQSGRMPSPIDPRSPWRGSSTEQCALFARSGGSKHTSPKGQQP